MRRELFRLAAEVIRQSSKTTPADSVLRQKLKMARLNRREASETSRALFSYYRWFGWCDEAKDLEAQVEQALKLAADFEAEALSDQELLERAVPGWVRQEVNVNAQWVRALQTEPKLWLRARPGAAARISRELGHCRCVEEVPDALEYVGREDLFSTQEFHRGAFEIQDLSSQKVGFLCAPKAGETWWDACAGEGGKLLHLADLMGNRGLIWGTDRIKWRLDILRRRAARAGIFNYRSRIWNGQRPLPFKTRFDGVLVDAPCSGLGTWHRNPHARWTTSMADVRELAVVQLRLLGCVAEAVKPGGRLIYAVCTLTRSETTAVREAFEASHREFERLALRENDKSPPTEEIWMWPQKSGGNGMYVAGWQRRA